MAARSGYTNFVIFVHIPKTAGTSLRRGFEQAGSHHTIIKSYLDTSRQTTKEYIKHFKSEEGRRAIYSEFAEGGPPGRPLFLCGHFNARLYARIFPLDRFALFLRNPVDRVISAHGAWRRRHDPELSLEDYIQMPRAQNVQSRFITGVNYAEIGFLGLTENYQDDLLCFSKFSGATVENLHYNVKGRKKKILSHELRQHIEDLNAKDMVLYNDVVAERKKRGGAALI